MAGILDYLGIPQDPQSGGGSLLSQLGAFAGNNSNALIGLGAGIAGGGKNWNEAIGRGMQGFQTGQQQDIGLRNQQQLLSGLISQGIHPSIAQAAAQNPKILEALLPRLVPKYDFHNVDNTMVQANPYDPNSARVIGSVPKVQTVAEGSTLGTVNAPGQMNGQPPAPMGGPVPGLPGPMPGPGARPPMPQPQPQAPTFTPILQTPEKAPQNYTWNDPKNPTAGATRIPGTEPPMSKDEAAMVAMLQASKMGVQSAKGYFLDPNFKGSVADTAWKAATSATNTGDISRHTRAVRMGAEAALRLATGAAAPASEVKTYADFYTPSVYDSTATRQQKLDALGRFMDYAERNMKTGRLVPLNEIPKPDKFMQGGAAAGPVKDQSRVQNPAWPPPPPGFVMGQ